MLFLMASLLKWNDVGLVSSDVIQQNYWNMIGFTILDLPTESDIKDIKQS